jgi:hypothetical protein
LTIGQTKWGLCSDKTGYEVRQNGGVGQTCDPITGMARIAMNKKTPVELRARMYSELAQYVACKRKAVEHSSDSGTIETLLLRLDGEAVDGAAALPGLPRKRAMIPPNDAMASASCRF